MIGLDTRLWLIDRMLSQGTEIFGYRHPRDGRFFPIYPDPRRLLADREWVEQAARALVSQIPSGEDVSVCGVATGGITLATAVAEHLGTMSHVVYPRPPGDNAPFCYTSLSHSLPLLLVDDATGIGLTKLRLVETLVSSGYKVRLLSLQAQGRGLVPRYGQLRVDHRCVYSCVDLVERALSVTLISPSMAATCLHWIRDAASWDHTVGPGGFAVAAKTSKMLTMTPNEIAIWLAAPRAQAHRLAQSPGRQR
jgi:hypothetical protein